MSFARYYLEVHEEILAEAEGEMFGHLAPKPRVTYSGRIIWAYTKWGEVNAIQSDFGDLPDSPWFMDDMNEYLEIYSRRDEVKPGAVMEFSWALTPSSRMASVGFPAGIA